MEYKQRYCKKTDCDVMTCRHNPKNIKEYGALIEFVHLEDNPLYCTKGNWYGYQVEENKDDQD